MKEQMVFNRTAHMNMWLTIADRVRVKNVIPYSIKDAKKEALLTMWNGEEFPRSNCFACDYTKGCAHCPLVNELKRQEAVDIAKEIMEEAEAGEQ